MQCNVMQHPIMRYNTLTYNHAYAYTYNYRPSSGRSPLMPPRSGRELGGRWTPPRAWRCRASKTLCCITSSCKCCMLHYITVCYIVLTYIVLYYSVVHCSTSQHSHAAAAEVLGFKEGSVRSREDLDKVRQRSSVASGWVDSISFLYGHRVSPLDIKCRLWMG